MKWALLVAALGGGAAACVANDIGTPCSAAAPCALGSTCDLAQPGGSCTGPCPGLGELGSRDLSDFTCAIAADGGLQWAHNCNPTSAFAGCRTGYTCRPPDGGTVVATTGVCLFP